MPIGFRKRVGTHVACTTRLALGIAVPATAAGLRDRDSTAFGTDADSVERLSAAEVGAQRSWVVAARAATPVRVFAALGLCVAVARSVTTATAQGRLVPARPDRAIAVGVIGAVSATVALAAFAVDQMSPVSDGLVVVTSTMLLLGIQLLCGVAASSSLQAMAPVCFVLIASLLGRSQGVVRPWAWVLDASPSTWLQCSGPVVLLAGMLALLARGFRAPRGRE